MIFGTSYLKWLVLQGYYLWGNGINFVPPVAQTPLACPGTGGIAFISCPPFLARSDDAS